uniref:hypothetical protein n=1 Tax=Peribacillus butanolivorans TaxID=421767 RepID=UPI0036D23D3B
MGCSVSLLAGEGGLLGRRHRLDPGGAVAVSGCCRLDPGSSEQGEAEEADQVGLPHALGAAELEHLDG